MASFYAPIGVAIGVNPLWKREGQRGKPPLTCVGLTGFEPATT
jgi:hypothetical protein